ncbi:MAG: ArsC family (seleno)protein [Planctomycetota bacterium]|nr:ArsC family (seleno)protein [Planctomycetota bacterium]MDA1137368.1 ArsC family (seleno)protein [Planctomycetota bacterium]
MSCTRAQEFLATKAVKQPELTDARKVRIGEDKVDQVLSGVTGILVAKGKKVVAFDMTKDPPERAELLKHVLGPSGNLRAPSIRIGKTLLVGFSDEAYAGVFGE